MTIPVLNIYYLLCYAWDKLEEGEKVSVSTSDYSQLVDLFARVLINGCNRLLKMGIERNYVAVTSTYPGIKGKIRFTPTLNANLIRQGKTICDFDELQTDILTNQILKATCLRVSKVKNLDAKLRGEMVVIYRELRDISDIEINLSHFSLVRLHRNNSFYDLLLKVCRMIHESIAVSEGDGKLVFKDFDRESLGPLFEAFVRNFYRKEQTDYTVGRPKIKWAATAVGNSDLSLLPDMNTDLVLESRTRKIVLDTKFYQNTTMEYFGSKKFQPTNLYQLYSYLKNLEQDGSNKLNRNSEGILLYPTVDSEYDQSYLIGEHKLRIVTVDLGKNWREISGKLKSIIA